jgi:hypothetical protein
VKGGREEEERKRRGKRDKGRGKKKGQDTTKMAEVKLIFKVLESEREEKVRRYH